MNAYGVKVGWFILYWGWAFVNLHHFRPTGQVLLRSRGWSFIYADEIKNVYYRGKI